MGQSNSAPRQRVDSTNCLDPRARTPKRDVGRWEEPYRATLKPYRDEDNRALTVNRTLARPLPRAQRRYTQIIENVMVFPDDDYSKWKVDGCRDPVRPCYIARLPTELLCAIFLLCGDPNPLMGVPLADVTAELYSDHLHCYSKAAVTLGRVCSTWLGVTRGYPLLWTIVDIAPPNLNSLAVLKSCLEYSGSLPLSLELDLSNYRVHTQVNSVLKRLMRTVARNAHRWSSISMMLYRYTKMLHRLIVAPHGAFTSLESVSIEAYHVGPWQSNPVRGLYESFCTSPHLRAVRWWSEPIALDAPQPAIANLTHVDLFLDDGTAEILTILRRCNRLQILQFIFHDSCDQPQSSLGTVHLPHLQTLMLRSIHYDFTWLYKCLVVPRLMRVDVAPRYPQGEAIEHMLSQSRASLCMLNWGFPRYWHLDDLVGLLHSEPLRSLRVLRYLARPHCRTAETFSEVARLVPSHVETYTASYSEAESAFYRMC